MATTPTPDLAAALATIEKSRAVLRATVTDENARNWLLGVLDELERRSVQAITCERASSTTRWPG
jgi:hypothetical protein